VCLTGGPSLVSGRGGRRDGQTGGEIPLDVAYRRMEK
jgi:hypothetical protein